MPDQRVGVALRRVVQARARDLCEYCRCPAQFATQSFTVEHVEPREICQLQQRVMRLLGSP